MRRARSSSDQWETGVPVSAGLVVARTRTWWRSWGGKNPWPATPRAVEQALQPSVAEAAAPARDGVGVAAEFGGHVVVARHAGLGRGAAEDNARPQGQPLGRGACVDQLVELP